ncbi:N-acetylglucosaminidase [Lysinibacillus halotolerans]
MKKLNIILILVSVFVFLFLDQNVRSVDATSEYSTSKLGHLNNADVLIYKDYTKASSSFKAGSQYMNAVYYIKKQAIHNGDTFYLMSTQPSSTSGVVGWVKSSNVQVLAHATISGQKKTLYVKGNGRAYRKAWGGTKDVIYNEMSKYSNLEFKVDLTETVGKMTWYRGTVNGVKMWLQSNQVIIPNSISLLGHINGSATTIYPVKGATTPTIEAKQFFNAVYYIKSFAYINNELHYIISTAPSSERGVVGWIKAKDTTTYAHKTVTGKRQTFYFKGTGKAYSKAWGGSKDLVFDNLSPYSYESFQVNLTETVGANTWYRGTLNGKTIWLHANDVLTTISKVEISKTSLLGHLKSNATIYKLIGQSTSTVAAPYTNTVYYIKKQVKVNGILYYLISMKPSSEQGTVGWVKSTDLNTQAHKTISSKAKTLYIHSTGKAYSKAWGGTKDIVFSDMSDYQFLTITVNLTETVGNTTWYRGILNGKTIWLHENDVVIPTATSLLGHINGNATTIYRRDGNISSTLDATSYFHAVYYIKTQGNFNGEVYYLISKTAGTEGIIGWISSTNMTEKVHKTVDHQGKSFYLKGTGTAYQNPWGGTKDIIYSDLSQFSKESFQVNLTESVGSDVWYRGTLAGKTVWISDEYVNKTIINYTKYDLSLSEALALQMKATPQTDKYRNLPGYVSRNFVEIVMGGSTTSSGVRLRTSPKLDTNNNVYETVPIGTAFTILDDNIIGDATAGSTRWYKIQYNGKELYVHRSLVRISSNLGKVKSTVNSRSEASEQSHIYGKLVTGTFVTIYSTDSYWAQIALGVWRNATQSDVSEYLNPNHFVNDPKQKFQFLDLSKSSGVSVTVLDNYLKNRGIFHNLGEAFVQAGAENGINELYLVSHALLETGHGTSELAQGIQYNGTVVYNMYGIEAFDHCPNECGAKKAFEEGWTTPEKAIIGGAKYIANDYIKGKNHTGTIQNTLYKMRWNPEAMDRYNGASHQYATDIGWAYKQINSLYNLYQTLGINNMIMDVPVYR